MALQFSISCRTIQCIWKQSECGLCDNVSHRRIKNCGRKRIELDCIHFREAHFQRRTTIRSLACALNMKNSTLHRRLKSGDIRRHSNAIKPHLLEENKYFGCNFAYH